MKSRSYKLVVLGEASVGKSSLLLKFVNDEYSDAMETTVGAAFFTRSIEVDGETIRYEMWDTAGQERFATLAPMYYRSAAAAIVVYDKTSMSSFERAKLWVEQLHLSANANIVIALAANKSDLPQKCVDESDARKFADDNGLIFLETSAKTGHNVFHLFTSIARRLPKDTLSSTTITNTAPTGIRLTSDSISSDPSKKPLAQFTCCRT